MNKSRGPLALYFIAITIFCASIGSGTEADTTALVSRPYDDCCNDQRDAGYAVLYTAKNFSIEWIDSKSIPDEVFALRCLTREANAIVKLFDLTRHGTLAGQLYALVGIRALDELQFRQIISRYNSNNEQVKRAGTDIDFSTAAAVIAKGIEYGHYVSEFLPAFRERVPHRGIYFEIAPSKPQPE